MLRSTVIFPQVHVADAEFRRLLGYPRDAAPSARAEELADWARSWFAEHGRPWMYLRELNVRASEAGLALDGVAFPSAQLRRHLDESRAAHAVVFAVSAGRSCEEHARELWREGKPDEYFFLETYGSAVVERLTALVNARVCAEAESRGLQAIPHYSPGYGGWDVAEQPALFEVVERGRVEPFPERLEVLPSGMLKPKKSLLGVIGLGVDMPREPNGAVPCERCTWSPCAYRRVPYRYATASAPAPAAPADAAANGSSEVRPPLAREARYSLAPRALEKWVRERLHLQTHADGAVTAVFRFDGTTCSNMGRPLAFEYRIELGNPATCYRIESTSCRPVAGDDGYQSMCEYLRDPEGLLASIATEKPLLGRPLDDVLAWQREPVSTGCYCDAGSRAHKWGMALEVLHFALARQNAAALARESKPSTNQPQVLTTDGHG